MNNLIKRGEGKKAILMLHGRGGSAEDIISLSHNFDATSYAFTANNNAWYPMPFMRARNLNEPYLSESLNQIKEAIEFIRKNHDEVFVLGFSQGACLALEIGAMEDLRGVIAFSGGFIGEDNELLSSVKTKNVFISCSFEDPFIPLKRAQDSAKIYEYKGAKVFTNFYAGQSHHITPKDIKIAREIID